MHLFSTPAIVLKRIQHGDSDLIITLLTLKKGKLSVIAKAAKKSKRRFAGMLELFSMLDIVGRIGKTGRGMPVLQEASLHQPLPEIRVDVLKTAYASYWSELIYLWSEEGQIHAELFQLFSEMLGALNSGQTAAAELNVIFQTRFLSLAGLSPNLNRCARCKTDVGKLPDNIVNFLIRDGGILCRQCSHGARGCVSLHKGTLKQMQWVRRGHLKQAARIRFHGQALREAELFLEQFVPYHIGKKPKSLAFLNQIRCRPQN
jgi:DNA repair protein RecO (recombination protein O)